MSTERPTSQALRERFEREYLLPLARAVFELEPRCQSVLVSVGQYWCDEAADAVHCHEIACAERDPVWPAAGQVREGTIGDPEAIAQSLKEDGALVDSEPSDAIWVQEDLWEEAHQRAFGGRPPWVLDDNTDMIVAFASYCEEESDQEQPSWRAHTPYGLIRRPAEGAEARLDVVGRMHRPEWENRWDAVDPGFFAGEALPRAPDGGPALSAQRARARQTLLSRWWIIVLVIALLALLRWAQSFNEPTPW
jgi:hypothetical protein